MKKTNVQKNAWSHRLWYTDINYHYKTKSSVRSQPGILRCESGKSTKLSLCPWIPVSLAQSKPQEGLYWEIVEAELSCQSQKRFWMLREEGAWLNRMPWGVSKRMIDSVFVHHRFLHIWDRCPEREGSAVVNSFPLKTVECWVREGHSAAKAKIWTFFWAGESSL